MVSSNTSTTTALLRSGPGFGSSFGLGISFPAFYVTCYLCYLSTFLCYLLPRILLLLVPAWKQLEVWGFRGLLFCSFNSVLPSSSCEGTACSTKYCRVVVLLEELVNLVTAIPVVLERGLFPPLCWFMAPLLWPGELLPVTAPLVRACRVLPFLRLLLCMASWAHCAVFQFFFFFVGVLLGESAHFIK